MFAIPWQGKVLLGTTDTPRPELSQLRQLDDPQPLPEEIGFLLRTAAGVLNRSPTRADIRSAFAGLRPLIHPDNKDGKSTAALSREHAVLVSASGLVTVTGGKWTTYRLMAEQVIDRAIEVAGLPAVPCPTRTLKLHACPAQPGSDVYGTDAPLPMYSALVSTQSTWAGVHRCRKHRCRAGPGRRAVSGFGSGRARRAGRRLRWRGR
eukprot:TRINITY_DN10112_c0_g1_i3.p4 TRINITY_DN10112_c0_g1~~TRINITY_DN10112_c0_g1_i3.p4  ORF type:complete len:207 (-),score=22.61 TRINITY_DN10112_c0_g1_i3:364-984(-)